MVGAAALTAIWAPCTSSRARVAGSAAAASPTAIAARIVSAGVCAELALVANGAASASKPLVTAMGAGAGDSTDTGAGVGGSAEALSLLRTSRSRLRWSDWSDFFKENVLSILRALVPTGFTLSCLVLVLRASVYSKTPPSTWMLRGFDDNDETRIHPSSSTTGASEFVM